ncbi:MAG: hypothetical protein JO016_03310 [Actinobacteria bacterium]|nr:hypothetical protein [Actinomycetota bacterium]
MNRMRRSVNRAVNPLSTAATRWWCQSAVRHRLTGHGPAARQRRLIRQRQSAVRRDTHHGPSPPQEQMKARARAIDDLLAQDRHDR